MARRKRWTNGDKWRHGGHIVKQWDPEIRKYRQFIKQGEPALKATSVKVKCNGGTHTISHLATGELILHDHDLDMLQMEYAEMLILGHDFGAKPDYSGLAPAVRKAYYAREGTCLALLLMWRAQQVDRIARAGGQVADTLGAVQRERSLHGSRRRDRATVREQYDRANPYWSKATVAERYKEHTLRQLNAVLGHGRYATYPHNLMMKPTRDRDNVGGAFGYGEGGYWQKGGEGRQPVRMPADWYTRIAHPGNASINGFLVLDVLETKLDFGQKVGDPIRHIPTKVLALRPGYRRKADDKWHGTVKTSGTVWLADVRYYDTDDKPPRLLWREERP